MRRLLVSETLNEFLDYGKVLPFYHLTRKEHLKSLMNGVDPSKRVSKHAKSQGEGFYVFPSEDYALDWDGGKEADAMLEIKAPLNTKNFDIEFELHGIDSKEFWNTFLKLMTHTIKSQNLKLYLVPTDSIDIDEKSDKSSSFKLAEYKSGGIGGCFAFISKDPIKESDISFTQYWGEIITILPDLHRKGIGWFRILGPAADAVEFKRMFSTLAQFGFVDKFEEEVLDKSKALRYVGPIIKPTRFKIKANGGWSEWMDPTDI